MIRVTPISPHARTPKGRGTPLNETGRYERHTRSFVSDGWDTVDEQGILRTQVQIDRPRKIITRNTSPDLPFDRSINPYRGCEHGCIYCFARPTHAYLNLSPGLDFETQLFARPNAPDLLARELAKPGYKVAPLAIGTNTDPYQPIEQKHEIMRRCLQVLADFQHPVAIVTKGSLIERDIDILAPMAAQGLVKVGVTITSLTVKVSRLLEPRVPAPKRLLQVLGQLNAAGIPTRVMISPVIPGLTDHEIEKILKAARAVGTAHATWALLRLPLEVSHLFQDWLRRHYPDKFSKVMGKVREAHGGKDYDPKWGKRMRGEGTYAELIAQRFEKACARLGYNDEMAPLDCTQFRVPPRPGDQLNLFDM
ncbi:MAG: PA0069 family radical SAM protein [Pseudomonadota bacterium]